MLDRMARLMQAPYSSVYADAYRTHWWWRARERNVLRFVRRYGRWEGRARILDIGCGDGLIWPALEHLGDVEGIEPDGTMIAPDSPWRARIEVADFLTSRGRDDRYDLVVMLDVVEHIADDHAALARAASLLGDDGVLVLTVPALPLLWSEFDDLSGHARRYTRRSLRAALERAGLTVLDLRYYYAWPVLPLLARRAFFRVAKGEDSAFVKAPPRPVNWLLYRLSLVDHWITRRVPVPAGSSLVAVARRPRAVG